MTSDIKLSVPVLEANNFGNWFYRIKTILKRCSVLDVIGQDCPVVDANAGIDQKAVDLRLSLDAKAQSIIVEGVPDQYLDIIQEKATAKEQIEALKSTFNRVSSFTRLSLWYRLIGLKNNK